MKRLLYLSNPVPLNAPARACGPAFGFQFIRALNSALGLAPGAFTLLDFDPLEPGLAPPAGLISPCASAMELARKYFAQ